MYLDEQEKKMVAQALAATGTPEANRLAERLARIMEAEAHTKITEKRFENLELKTTRTRTSINFELWNHDYDRAREPGIEFTEDGVRELRRVVEEAERLVKEFRSL